MSRWTELRGRVVAQLIHYLSNLLPPVPEPERKPPPSQMMKLNDMDLESIAGNSLAAFAAANIVFASHMKEMARDKVLNTDSEKEQARDLQILAIGFTHALSRGMMSTLHDVHVSTMNHLSVAYHIGYQKAARDLNVPEAFREAFE